MGQITILGYHISVIRRARTPKHSTHGAWPRPSTSYHSRKTHKLSHTQKAEIAQLMGYGLSQPTPKEI